MLVQWNIHLVEQKKNIHSEREKSPVYKFECNEVVSFAMISLSVMLSPVRQWRVWEMRAYAMQENQLAV